MKKTVSCALWLFLGNTGVSAALVAFSVGNALSVFVLLLPVVLDVLAVEKHLPDALQKGRVFLLLSLLTAVGTILFCLYQFYVSLWDTVGAALAAFFAVLFYEIPCLVAAAVYFLRVSCRRGRGGSAGIWPRRLQIVRFFSAGHML